MNSDILQRTLFKLTILTCANVPDDFWVFGLKPEQIPYIDFWMLSSPFLSFKYYRFHCKNH